MDTREILKSSPLFSRFSDNGIAILSTICERKRFPAATPIYVENMLGESLFIIVNGQVELSAEYEATRVSLAMLGPNEHFGQLALMLPGPRMLSATAHEDCELIEISRRPFMKLQTVKPQACLKLLLAICEENAALTRDLAPLMLGLVAKSKAKSKSG